MWPFWLWRARPHRQKGCFGLEWLFFSHKRLFLKILVVFHANLAAGYFFARTEGPGTGFPHFAGLLGASVIRIDVFVAQGRPLFFGMPRPNVSSDAYIAKPIQELPEP